MLANANAEIRRREHIQAATAEIQVVLTKYKITMQDIDPRAFNKKRTGKTSQTGKTKVEARDNRKHVKIKYAKPKGVETWSGRGLAPAWVREICQKEGLSWPPSKRIDVSAEVETEQFLIPESGQSKTELSC